MLDLLSKFELYRGLLPNVQDQDGLIHSDECDSVGFSALVGTVPGVRMDITVCRDSKGQWFRRQVARPCYPNHSGSTISRDMLLMLYWYIWENKRKDLAKGLYNYTISNTFIMGQGEFSRTYMTPNMLSTLGHLVHKLTGKNVIMRHLPVAFPKNATGYEAHLAVLHMLLRKRMGLGDYKSHFEAYKAAHPRNALFTYAAGYPSAASWILMDETLFPEDRLPTARDRKEPWIWQRDHGPSWMPADSDKRHSGGDFLFLTSLILRDKGLL